MITGIKHVLSLHHAKLFCIQCVLIKCQNIIILAGDQLAIAKETGRRLGMGTNMYPSSSLLSDNHTETISIDELIENADGFAGVFPGKR